MISEIRKFKLRTRQAAFFAIAVILARPASPQSYTISNILGGLPANGAVAKTTNPGPWATGNVTSDSAGNLYFTVQNAVFELTASTGQLTRVAGTGGAGYSGDNGPALSAQLNSPQGLAADSAGNLYIADYNNLVVRKVSGGIITTVAGNVQRGAPGGPHRRRPDHHRHLWRIDHAGGHTGDGAMTA